MPVTLISNLVFDSQAKVEKWFNFLDSSNLAEICLPEFVADGANSYARVTFASAVVPVSKLFRTQALMNADLSLADGLFVNCTDADPVKRGRYRKDGAPGAGVYTRVGEIADKASEDKNHVQRTLELLFCSWNDKDTIAKLVGATGWSGPADGTWSNLRITWDMRVIDFHLGPWAKICQHVQGNVERLTAALPQVFQFPAPDLSFGNWAYANYVFVGGLISDQLGFGNDSWGRPNRVPYIDDSGRRNVVLNYSASDLDWECLGRIDRPLAQSPYRYVAAPVADVITTAKGLNSYMMVVHDRPESDADFWSGGTTTVGDTNRVRGEMHIYGVKIERVT